MLELGIVQAGADIRRSTASEPYLTVGTLNRSHTGLSCVFCGREVSLALLYQQALETLGLSLCKHDCVASPLSFQRIFSPL